MPTVLLGPEHLQWEALLYFEGFVIPFWGFFRAYTCSNCYQRLQGIQNPKK